MEPILFEFPSYVPITVVTCVLIGAIFSIFSANNKIATLGIAAIWCGILVVIGYFMKNAAPSFGLLASITILPCLLLTIMSFLPVSRQFMRGLKDEQLHHLHLWRVPFAFVLLWFYQAGITPIDLTFEGINYDIIIGLTAPVIGSLAFSQKMLTKEIVLGWNAIGTLLLLISIIVVLLEVQSNPISALQFQQLPYLLLLGFLMPLSLFAHALSSYRILKGYVKVGDEE
jgi:hypothetical protein